MEFCVFGSKYIKQDEVIKVAFLDRDGVLNRNLGYVCSKERFYLMDNVIQALLLLQKFDYKIIFYTNQSGIARRYYSELQFVKFTRWIHSDLLDKGVNVLATYFCPHHPLFTGECSCRKPRSGMLEAALRQFKVNVTQSLAVGDNESDLVPAREIGIKNLFLLGENNIIKTNFSHSYTKVSSWNEISKIIKNLPQ